jgi:hypothetical protein
MSKDLVRDSKLFPSADGSYALATKTGIALFQSVDEVFASRGEFHFHDHGFSTGPDTLVVAIDKQGGIVSTRQSGGLYKTLFLYSGSAVSKVLVTFPHMTSNLESAAIIGDRLLFVFTQSPEADPTSVSLWDCPYDSIRRGLSATSCTTYKAPEAVETPAALASHNLSSFSDRYIDPGLACGDSVVVHHGGWLWLVDRKHHLNDLLFADGIISCSPQQNAIETYRARRVDTLRLRMRDVESSTFPLSIITPTSETSSRP